jgi:glycosyltransferase involved in cell wall biosynthesis
MIATFRPDILLSSQEYTIRAARMVKRTFGFDIPLLVVTEFAGDLADRGYSGVVANLTFPLLGLPPGKRFWPWLCSQASAVITCYPGDVERLDELSSYGTSVRFVPWCNELPAGFQPALKKERELAVYVGTFSRWKNTDAFSAIVPLILRNTPTKRILFVGSGRTQVVENLKGQFGSAVEHIPGLPRNEVLSELSSAYYGITTVKRGGWGFIGDCWAVQTPLVTLFNDYNLHHQKDSVVGGDLEGLIEGIQKLYSEPHLHQSMQNAGYQRYVRDHTASAVGSSYESTLKETLKRWSNV